MIPNLDYLKSVRSHLHQYPEIPGAEKQTADYLLAEIQKLNTTQVIKNLGGYGFLVVFDSGVVGDSLLFRAELDGLPITDTKDCSRQSKNAGFGYQCGHNGHMTILLGLAMHLSDNLPGQHKNEA